MRAICLLVAGALVQGCGSSDSGAPGLDIEVVTVDLSTTLGVQRELAWRIPSPYSTCEEAGHKYNQYDRATCTKSGTNSAGEPSVVRYDISQPTPTLLWDLPLAAAFANESAAGLFLRSTDDGGFLTAGRVAGKTSLARVSGAGMVLGGWTIEEPHADFDFTATPLPGGNTAVAYVVTPPNGSLASEETVVALYDSAGARLGRSTVASVTIAESTVENALPPPAPDGTIGRARINVMKPLPDGGAVAIGYYGFGLLYFCGGNACGGGASSAMIVRLSAQLEVVWVRYLGAGLATPSSVFRDVAVLADGSFLATGSADDSIVQGTSSNVLALAARFSSDGSLVWANAFTWGGAAVNPVQVPPFGFYAIAADASGGGARMILPPPGFEERARLIGMDRDGRITSVQALPGPAWYTVGQSLGTAQVVSLGTLGTAPAETILVDE